MSDAGVDPYQVFTHDALLAVFRASDGIPRLINQVCDHALVMGCAGGRQKLDTADIEEAWADLQQLPGPWDESESVNEEHAVVEFGPLGDEEFSSPTQLDLQPEEPTVRTAEFSDTAIEEFDSPRKSVKRGRANNGNHQLSKFARKWMMHN